jgi:ketosteroid isomerase-like protein
VSTTLQHELMRRDGELAVVMGSDEVRNVADGPLLRRRFTNVWRREGDRWRLFIRHATVIADHADPRPPAVSR